MSERKKVGAIIQARMGSSRLPGKSMMLLGNKPVLKWVVDRLEKSKNLETIIIATTTEPQDDLIAKEAGTWGIPVFRGSQDDVLDRYCSAAKIHDVGIVVRITSDCPFVDAEVVDSVIDRFNSDSYDYVSNTIERTYPRGMDVEVIARTALDLADKKAKEQHQREHVTPYIYENPEQFKIFQVKARKDNSRYRLTLDTDKDLDLMRKLFLEVFLRNETASLEEIITYLENHDEVAKINRDVEQKKLK